MEQININPLVSIITIVFNDGENLEKTINSVAKQTYKNIQYIVIDGGSTDNTLEIIKQYANNLDYWISEPDKGISDAFNKGIARATGELIGLINSGDFYENDAVQSVVDSYNSEADDYSYLIFHGKLRMFKDGFSKIYAPLSLDTFHYQMPIWHPTVFVNHEVYKNYSYDLSYKIAMDYDLFSRLFHNKNSKFIYTDKLISNMDIGGISNSQASKGFREVMLASRKNLQVGTLKSAWYFYFRSILNKVIKTIKG